jgi:cobalt-zinc-cadmium efflux system protein
VLIVYESIRRLVHPAPVEGGVVVVAATIALVANGAAALLVRERGDDLNMRAVLVHMAADAAASLGVAVAGGIILVTGRYERLDPAVSLLIGVLIAWQGWRLLKSTADVLLESTPKGLEPADVQASMRAVAGVEDVHDLHIWSLSSDVRALSAHVLLEGHPSVEEAQAVGTNVKAALSGPYCIVHATLEFECEGCVDDGSWCTIAGLEPPSVGDHAGHHH